MLIIRGYSGTKARRVRIFYYVILCDTAIPGWHIYIYNKIGMISLQRVGTSPPGPIKCFDVLRQCARNCPQPRETRRKSTTSRSAGWSRHPPRAGTATGKRCRTAHTRRRRRAAPDRHSQENERRADPSSPAQMREVTRSEDTAGEATPSRDESQKRRPRSSGGAPSRR